MAQGLHLPFQQDHLQTEPWTHSQQYAVCSGCREIVHQHFLKHKQNRGGREITELPQTIPRSFQFAIRQSQRVLNRVQYFWSARVDYPIADVGAPKLVFAQERVDIPGKVSLNQLRQVRRKHNLEAGLGDIPTHDFFGIRVEYRAGTENLRTLS